MPRLRPAKFDELTQVLEKLGFVRVHQSGSHLRKILGDAKIGIDEFEQLR